MTTGTTSEKEAEGARPVQRVSRIVGGGYDEFWRCRKRYRVVKGGKASKKSTTAALWFIVNLMKPKYRQANLLVVRRVMDTNRTSTYAILQWAIRRLGVERYWAAGKTPLELVYRPTGQRILFRGFDDWQKLASITVPNGYLCWVWIEEGYEIARYEDFYKFDLSVPRGKVPPPLFKQTTITFNPWNEKHWLKEQFFDRARDDTLAITTDYRQNEFLDETDRRLFEEMRRTAPRKYAVAGLGEWGVSEGLVFENWEVAAFSVAEVTREKPWRWRHVFGLDYGYTNDPTAFIAAAVDPVDKRIYIYDEHYQTHMLNADIADMLRRKGYAKERIRADSAEPKSNEELRRAGIGRIAPAEKGADSIRYGIARLQEYRIVIHPLCRHTATEIATYRWDEDKSGHLLPKPVDSDNHLMDALRYAMADIKNFRPGEERPARPRGSKTGLNAADFSGGWNG